MSSIDRTAASARLRMRGLWLASTALVGIRVVPQPVPDVPRLAGAPSLLQARMARLLALAVETPASLLGRLGALLPKRTGKVRPAARTGRRRRWREAMLAAALVAAAPAAQAQTSTWNGADPDYNAAVNWSPNTPPVAAGQDAVFGSGGSATVEVAAGPIAPNAWTFNAGAQSYTVSGGRVNFGGAGLINNAASGTVSIANVIGGVGGVQQNGAGTLVLTGANTYSGNTTISGGVLEVNNGSALGAGAIIVNGGTLRATADANIAAPIFTQFGGTSAFSAAAGATLTAQLSSGRTAGTITFGSISDTGTVVYTGGGGELDVNAVLVVNGGTLRNGRTLNEITGLGAVITRVNAGTLDLANTATIIQNLQGTGGTVTTGTGALTVNQGNYAGTIGPAASLTKATAGTLTLSGANTYTGGTTVAGGRLIALNNGRALAAGTVLIASGATVELQNTTGDNINQNGNTFTGTGRLEKTGAGVFTIGSSGGASSVELGASGLISVQAGTLRASASGAGDWSKNQGGLTIAAGATFDTREAAVRVDGLNGAGVVENNFGGSLTVGVANGGGSFAGVLQDVNGNVLALTKEGAGTQILSGANTYTGATTINGGTLQIGAGGAGGSLAAASTVTVAGGATLALARTGTLNFGNAVSGAGRLTVQGATGASDLITLSGALRQTGGFVVSNPAKVTLTGSYIASVAGDGIVLNGGTFTNQGTITATGTPGSNAVLTSATADTRVVNEAGARIEAQGSGVIQNSGSSAPGALTVDNAGLIQGNNHDGVTQHGTGALTVTNSGVIYGRNAIGSANGYGVGSDGTGLLTLTNNAGGIIVGQYGAVGRNAGDRITNAGTIAAGSYTAGSGGASGTVTPGGLDGVQLRAGGTVLNQAGGTIQGSAGRGIRSTAGLSLTNLGTIAGTNDGVVAESGVSSVLNAGAISSSSNAGVNVFGASAGTRLGVVNAAGGTITGGTSTSFGYGVETGVAALSVDNYGTLTSTRRDAAGRGYGIVAYTGAPVTANLYAGSTTGNIALSDGNDTVSLYTGVVGAAAASANDPVSGTTATVRAAGDYAAAGFGTLELGGGTNTLNLRGTGRFITGVSIGTNTTGVAGILDQSLVTDATSQIKQESGTWTLTGTNTAAVGWALQGGALNVAGTLSTPFTTAVALSDGTTLRVASGGTISTTTGAGINGTGAFTIVNLGSMTNNFGSNVNTGATVTLITGAGSTLSSNLNEAFAAGGANSRIINATGATIRGGSDPNYGRVYLGNNATVANYGTIAGSATLAALNNTSGVLVAGTGSTVDLREGSTTGSVRLGNNSTLSLYTGSGTTAAAVTTPDPVTGGTITLKNAGTNAAAMVGGISLGTGGVIALRGIGDGSSNNGEAGALDMSNVVSATTLNKEESGTFLLTGSYGGALTTNVRAGRLIERVTGGVTSNVFGTGTVDISSGALVELNGSFLQGVNTFTGAGRIEKTGTGEVRFGSGNGQTIIQQSAGGVIDVQAGILRGSSSGNGIWTDNRGSLNIAESATFDGVEGAVVVDRLTGSGTLQGGFGPTARTTTIGVANGTDVFSGTIQDAPASSRTTDSSTVAILSLAKTGTGTQTLSGTSTYSGGTTISGGALKAGSVTGFSANSAFTVGTGTFLDLGGFGNTIGSLAGTGTVTNSGSAASTLTAGGNGATTSFSGLIQDGANATVGLTKTGAGTLTLSGASTYTGGTTVSAGRVVASKNVASTNASPLGASGPVRISAGATVELNTTNTGFTAGFNGLTFAGAGTLVKSGAGAAVFGQFSTPSTVAMDSGGRIDVQGGTLVASSNFQGTWGGNFASLNIEAGATFSGVEANVRVDALTGAGTLTGGFGSNAAPVGTTTIGVAGGSGTFSGTIRDFDGTMILTKAGAGTQTLSGVNTYTGTTTISGGTLALTGAGSVASSAGIVVGAGTRFDISGVTGTGAAITTLSGAGSVVLGAKTLSLSNAGSTFSGAIGGSGGLTLVAGSQTLSGINTYTGTTTVTAGTLGLSGGQALVDTGAVLVNGGTLSVGSSETIGSLAGTGGRVAIAAGQTLTAGGTNARTSYAGTLTTVDATGVFTKTGTGTQTLTGANGTGSQFTGTANVTAGTLAVNGTFGDTAGRAATVNVNTTGTLHGAGTIAGSVVVGSGGTVSAGNSPGTLTVGGDYTLDAGSTSLFEMGSAGRVGGPAGEAASNDLINVGGSLTLGGALQLVDTASPANPIVSGYYRLFNYDQNGAGGTVTGAFGSVSVASGSTADVYTSVPNQVNVLVRNGAQSLQFWDGGDTSGVTPGAGGGAGTWSTANTNWTTNPDGQVNDAWRSGVGVFAGEASTVTVEGVQSVQGLQFATTGYTLTGGSLNLGGNPANADTNSFINVDAGVGATIASALTGSAGLTKLGGGTLTLSGDNGYGGGTVFAAGTLEAASTNALGTGGTLSFTGGTLRYGGANATDYSARFSTAATQAYRVDTNGRDVGFATGLTSSNGSLTKLGGGTLILTGASTYAGATTISGGTLQVGDGGTGGSLAAASAVTLGNFATLALNRSGPFVFGNDVSGTGRLVVRGATGANDSTTLSGALRQTGGFTVADASKVTLTGSYEAGSAINLTGGATFTNRGSIDVQSDAILASPTPDTTVVNAAGARIVGGFSGVIQVQATVSGSLTVTNSGLIQGTGYDGVTQHGTGALIVTNTGTGVIYGQNNVESANGYGVGSDGGGRLTLTNAAGGEIVGQYGVVGSNVNDQVINAGTIASGFYDIEVGGIRAGGIAGVALRAGGTVTNQAGGVIQSGQRGVVTQGNATLRVDNAGTVSAGSDGAIQALGAGNALVVVNRAGGSVTGGSAGIYAGDGANQGNTITLVNAGTISAANGVGVGGGGGSGVFTITNAAGATIRGGGNSVYAQGIQLNGAAGSTVDNYGTIVAGAGTSNAIASTDESRAINLYAGSIVTGGIALGGGNDAVALYTGTGTANAAAVTAADPVLGGENRLTIRAAGTHAAAVFGAIDLGGGANTLTLRGAGDGTAANGVAGTLDLGAVSRAGTFDKVDGGTWTLTGQSAAPLAGTTANIRGGILAINGVFGDAEANDAAVNVEAGGTLHGTGTVAGSVVVNGGTVSAGNSPGTLTVARDYTLNAGSTSLFELGAPGVAGGESNDLIAVGRNLQLGGTLSLVSATDAATAPVSGAYRLYNYGGALSGAFDTVSTPTAGSTGLVYTDIPNQVNVLLINGNQSVQYWDGADTTGAGIGGQGGAGTWSTTATNWTTLPGGSVNDVWRSGVGIFGGTAGAVTVAGAQNVQGLQFVTDGYSLGGAGTLNLTGDPATTPSQSFVNVDAGVGVTIANALTSTGGSFGLRKIGDGTLTLTGASTYAGATTVEAGTLAIAASGSVVSAVTNRATFTNAGTATGGLTNAGAFTNTGTLSGGLTNTGTVTVSAGRIDGTITNNAGTFTVSGNVASDGTLINAGGATLAVTGSGAYALGGLLTNAGSLTVASGGSLTAPAGIVNSGSIRVAQGGTITDALANTGNVGNDGAYNADVSNAASGTIANTATGTWTGNLTANTGALSNAGQWRGDGRNEAGGNVTNTGAWTTATGPFANAGTLATSGVLVGGIANTGSVQASGQVVGAVSNGAGASFALTGPLTGVATFANNGTLDLGGTAFTVGSLSGTATAATLRNGALTTGGDNGSTAYAGSIVDGAGATSLVKNGTGSLTLTGVNTYTGGTTVNAGTIVAAASALGRGPVTNNADLIVDQADDATLGSAVNGIGRFVKRGAGALTYTGTGTLTGATTVEAGRLGVDGSLGNSVVTVANGATLGGSGTVGGVVATAGGAVAPGASPGTVGTLRVAGNVLFASRSLYQVDATAAGQADRIAATGTATLEGGTVQVTAQAGLYSPTTSYTILSAAGGVTGRFAGVTSNFAYLTPFLTYGANEATLRLARNDLQFGATAQTRNQGNVAGAAQATGVGARLYDAVAVLSAPQSRVAFDALSGEIHASAVTAQFENAFLVREAVLDRLRWGDTLGFGGGIGGGIGQRFAPGTTLPGAYTADLPGRAPALAAIPTRLVDPNPVAVWGQGFGSFGQTASDGNAARLARQTSGFVLGADARVENDWRLGAAGGYSFTNVDVTGRLSSGTVESGFGALYAGGPLGPRSPLQLRLGATYGGNSLTTRRAVTFAGLSESAGARYGGTTAQGFAEVGYRIGTGASTIEPFVGAAAIRLGRDGFGETGGASALTAQSRDYDIATSTVGLRAEGRLAEVFATDLPIMVRALVGYRRAYGDVVPSALLAFAGGQQFVSAGIPIDRDALVAQAGIDWQLAPTTTLGVNYTGQVGQRAQDHGVKGNFTYRF